MNDGGRVNVINNTLMEWAPNVIMKRLTRGLCQPVIRASMFRARGPAAMVGERDILPILIIIKLGNGDVIVCEFG